MRNRFGPFQIILALSILLTACGGSEDAVVGGIPPCTVGPGPFTDGQGDVPFDFIDMTRLNLVFAQGNITAEIDLAGTVSPGTQVPYDDPNTLDNALENGWEVMFDINGDGDCFSPGDIKIAVAYFRPSIRPPPAQATLAPLGSFIPSITQEEVWVLDGSGSAKILQYGSPPAPVPVSATVANNRLIMSVGPIVPSMNSIVSITPTTPVRFETTHVSSGTTFKDRHPD